MRGTEDGTYVRRTPEWSSIRLRSWYTEHVERLDTRFRWRKEIFSGAESIRQYRCVLPYSVIQCNSFKVELICLLLFLLFHFHFNPDFSTSHLKDPTVSSPLRESRTSYLLLVLKKNLHSTNPFLPFLLFSSHLQMSFSLVKLLH